MRWWNWVDAGLIMVGVIAAATALWSLGHEWFLMGTGCILISLGMWRGATK